MKKTFPALLITFLIVGALVFSHSAYAQTTVAPAPTTSTGFVALAPIPGLTQGATASTPGLASFLNNLYKYLIGLAAILAVVQIIRGGLEIATQDSVSKHADGRKHIEQALLGLVLVLSPALVFSIINPSILNLSLNLPPISTAPGAAVPATSGSGTSGTGAGPSQSGSGSATVNGCNSTTGSVAYTAVSCDNNTDATNWSSANCGGEAVISQASCPGGVSANGSCSNGQLTWQVLCPGTSAQSFTFYQETVPSFFGGNAMLAPIPSNVSAVTAFVNACGSANLQECFPSGHIPLNEEGVGSEYGIAATGNQGTCPTGQTYSKFVSTSAYTSPACVTVPLLCTNSTLSGCTGGFSLDDNP